MRKIVGSVKTRSSVLVTLLAAIFLMLTGCKTRYVSISELSVAQKKQLGADIRTALQQNNVADILIKIPSANYYDVLPMFGCHTGCDVPGASVSTLDLKFMGLTYKEPKPVRYWWGAPLDSPDLRFEVGVTGILVDRSLPMAKRYVYANEVADLTDVAVNTSSCSLDSVTLTMYNDLRYLSKSNLPFAVNSLVIKSDGGLNINDGLVYVYKAPYASSDDTYDYEHYAPKLKNVPAIFASIDKMMKAQGLCRLETE